MAARNLNILRVLCFSLVPRSHETWMRPVRRATFSMGPRLARRTAGTVGDVAAARGQGAHSTDISVLAVEPALMGDHSVGQHEGGTIGCHRRAPGASKPSGAPASAVKDLKLVGQPAAPRPTTGTLQVRAPRPRPR